MMCDFTGFNVANTPRRESPQHSRMVRICRHQNKENQQKLNNPDDYEQALKIIETPCLTLPRLELELQQKIRAIEINTIKEYINYLQVYPVEGI